MAKINIFGVGRSGTKAVQLWLSYLLIQKFGEVKLVYEPFLYKNRFLETSLAGKLTHKYTPLFLDEDKEYPIPKYFLRFCNHISKSNPLVAKFIRGNGRINTINNLIKPDLSVLIVRDLYEVLSSVALQSWNLVENKFEWERLSNFTEKRYPHLKDMGFDWRNSPSCTVKNSIYWFTMNMFALENLDSQTIVLDYNQFIQDDYHYKLYESLESLDINISDDMRISNSLFRGKNIHKYTSFVSQAKKVGDIEKNNQKFLQKAAYKSLFLYDDFSEFDRLSVLKSTLLSSPLFFQEEVGSSCFVLKSAINSSYENKVIKPIKCKVQQHPFLDNLSEQIKNKIAELSYPCCSRTRSGQ